jgi:hypothetical protein
LLESEKKEVVYLIGKPLRAELPIL